MRAQAGPLGLAKLSSNLFRDRQALPKRRLDLRALCQVLGGSAQEGWVDTEGLTTYEDIVNWTLPRGFMPAVVPQLKTITAGGAVAGVGIEATSFRQGLVHDTLQEIEVLLPGGEIVVCTPGNEHKDLFFGFPNSYGTLGYALRLRLGTLSTKPMVRVDHLKYEDSAAFLRAMALQCAGDADFVDGVVFGRHEHALSVARFEQHAPWQSDYTLKDIYYQSVRNREVDFLSAHDYLWRWDADWFWCSRNFGAERPLVRRMLGRKHLNSRHYQQWMRWNTRWGLTHTLARLQGRYQESVIQDVDIPFDRAAEFMDFLHREIGILPVWVCPIRAPDPARAFTLYPLSGDALYLNFGFWDVVQSRTARPSGHFNRLVESRVIELGGIKSLYSECFFTREQFDRAYAMDRYRALKRKYDPNGRAPGLYEKCVLGC